MALTTFSRAATAFVTLLFGKVVVRERHLPRARRIFKATLEENDCNPHFLPEQAEEALMTEIIERARMRDPSQELRWKHLIAEIVAVGEQVCSALKERPVEDKRVRDILTVHRLI